jgi:hypothetical protein
MINEGEKAAVRIIHTPCIAERAALQASCLA